ncbi:MAG: hypothetical protein IKC10_02785 [Alphaproteobacteria bacterium]|nr:hypothetical protein [Alphaproteobacteria bacterium]MBR3918975.1 hypothetical protein [Clostridia bacterium]
MKKAIPLILLLSTLIFPVYYIICCISNNYLIIKIFVIWPVIIFFISLLFIIIKKIPFAVKLGISFVSVFISIGLIFINYTFFYPPLELQITTDNDALSKSNESFFREIESYESAVNYYINLEQLVMHQCTNTLTVKFDENDFSEIVEDIDDNFEFCENPVEGAGSLEFACYGFSFRALKEEIYPIAISFIGINYNTNEIAYVWSNNPRNGHSGTFEEIFDYACLWDYVDAYRQGGIWNLMLKRLTE